MNLHRKLWHNYNIKYMNLHGKLWHNCNINYMNLHGELWHNSNINYMNLHGKLWHNNNINYMNLHGKLWHNYNINYMNLHGKLWWITDFMIPEDELVLNNDSDSLDRCATPSLEGLSDEASSWRWIWFNTFTILFSLSRWRSSRYKWFWFRFWLIKSFSFEDF